MGELDEASLTFELCARSDGASCRAYVDTHPQDNMHRRWDRGWPGQIYMWTSDFHPGPLMCQAPILRELGVVLHAEVDHGHCEYDGTCRDRLRNLPCPPPISIQFTLCVCRRVGT